MRYRFIPLFLLVNVALFGQKNEKQAIEHTINQFFEGMQKGDTALILAVMTDEPILQSYMADNTGELQIFTDDFSEFIAFIGTPHTEKLDERIQFESIQVEKSLASVWTPYRFYLNDKISHCGTNSFQLIKQNGSWKIQYILDTRRKQGCD